MMHAPSLSPYSQELNLIYKAITLATERIRNLYFDGLIIHTKTDGSPVTNGDLEVDRILRKALEPAFPDDGWLSEECPDTDDRLQKTRVWIVDPIDGTRPFTKALPQYTISLALVEQGKPVLGVIVNPATGERFSAVYGKGARLNGNPLAISDTTYTRPTFLISTGSFPRRIIKDWNLSANCRPVLGSIAYSLALTACGQVDGVINLGQQYEWDVAAASLIVQEAGGILLDKGLQPVEFNKAFPTVDGIIALNPKFLPLTQTLLKSVF